MSAYEYKLPDVGEGLVEAEIVSWKVKPGDSVKVNDVIVEIETAKSLVELPSPYAGTIGKLLVDEGVTVEVGTPIVAIERADTAAREAPSDDGEAPAKTLVGYGPRAASTRRRARKGSEGGGAVASPAAASAPAPSVAPPVPDPAPVAPAPAPVAPAVSAAPAASAAGNGGVRVLAKPPVRKLAKDLGIDLASVPATGPNGTVTREDVESYRSGRTTAPAAAQVSAGERETRVPIRGVRKATAEAVTRSAQTVPHVTEWVTVDVTETIELIGRLRRRPEFADVKLSPLLVVAKACMLALRRTPELNATWDEPAQEIVLKHYVNLGIAAATPRGLIVPHVKDADRLALADLATALGELTATARAGKTQPAEMIGTTFTITNVGVFGVDAGTPILNPGETGILAIGAIQKRPWVVDDAVVPRSVTTLALSFDHRVVDGEQGSRFLADVAAMLEDPALTVLHA